MEFSVRNNSCLIRASSGDAPSRMWPNLSSIWSMCCISCGNVITLSVSLYSAGYSLFVLSSCTSSISFCVLCRVGERDVCGVDACKKVTIRWMVSNDRRRSNSSCSSKCVPSRRMRDMLSRTSKKFCVGKLSASSRICLNSLVCSCHSLMACGSVENAISSTFSLPRLDRQCSRSNALISLKFIFCSKLCG